jgi:hypothetical protein
MIIAINGDIADRLDEASRLLAEQGASPYRVHAYERAAAMLRNLARPVRDIWAAEGLAGLEKLPAVGESIARAIREMIVHRRWAMLERLRGEHDPRVLLASVPGIGKKIARKLYEELGIQTLADLEAAAQGDRLQTAAGIGTKRLAGIRDSLAHRLGRIRGDPFVPSSAPLAPVAELLEVDAEYREAAAEGRLPRITPRRFNPKHKAWLPVLHTRRGGHDYTALYSNTARAHRLGRDHDWVILYRDGAGGEYQCTVITARFGPLEGRRIVRGREAECADYHGIKLSADTAA